MPATSYRSRRAHSIESDSLRVTVTEEGGHVAEIAHKASGVNPLWTPPWPSIEPSTYSLERHPEYGADAESKLLAGLMGHNLCLDIFGGVSDEEAAAGLTVHGEASVARYAISQDSGALVVRATFPQAQLQFERLIALDRAPGVVRFTETVENLAATDRPVGWTQHVTLGPPFLEKGATEFRASATRSRTFDKEWAGCYMTPGADFDWPHAPLKEGGTADLRVMTARAASGAFTSHLMDPAREHAHFLAWAPASQLAFGYVWRRRDFPWLGIWEENYGRAQAPWNGCTLTRGMEFGVSPVPETRRAMIERGSMFGVPSFGWIPARKRVTVEYCAVIAVTPACPESLEWSEGEGARFV